jgi:hypothetical protein
MMKLVLPEESVHVVLPPSVQEPVIVAAVNVPTFVVPCCAPVSVPVRFPVRVRVLPFPWTVNEKFPVTSPVVLTTSKFVIDPAGEAPVTGRQAAWLSN